MEQYIANKKIFTVFKLEDKKTPSGEDMVEVTYENGEKEIMPKKRLELLTVSSEKPSDPTSSFLTLKSKVSSILYSILIEYGIKMGEVNGVIDGAIDLVNNAFGKSSNILWKTEDKDFISLNKVNDILLENVSTEEKQ